MLTGVPRPFHAPHALFTPSEPVNHCLTCVPSIVGS